MKNIIIIILAITTLVAGYSIASSRFRLRLEGIDGKLEVVRRGDLTLPIDATGEVQAAYRLEIKSEASGEVAEIKKKAGDRVVAGDLLIRLQPDDEQRTVDRATLDLEVAAARLKEAELVLEQAKTADLRVAQARVDQLVEAERLAKFRMEKLAALPETQRNEEEMLTRETGYQSQVAQLEAARADLEKVRLAIPRAEQSVHQASAAHESASTNLKDAEKRLRETSIIAPIDGIVADVKTQVGAVIQGGKTTFTGGTVLAVLLDMDKLIVRAEVDESDIGRVLHLAPPWARPGHASDEIMPARLEDALAQRERHPEITVESFRDQTFTGVVERIYPEPRTLSGVVTYLVDVVIASENRSILLPGMRADVEFTSEHVSNVVLCPNEAIREGPMGKLGVYIPKASADPQAHETEFVVCTFGLDNGNYSEVRSGLEPGTQVYTKLPRKSEDN